MSELFERSVHLEKGVGVTKRVLLYHMPFSNAGVSWSCVSKAITNGRRRRQYRQNHLQHLHRQLVLAIAQPAPHLTVTRHVA